MSLSLKDQLIMAVVPSSLYYRRKIADEAAWGEHELYVLSEIVPSRGVAIDVGANQGFFSFAFSAIGQQVEAFEPNSDYAYFAQRMLGSRARVHQVALSNTTGSAEFMVPVSEEGIHLHLGGKLRQPTNADSRATIAPVEVRTLDSYGFEDVRAIKVDVEGSEMDVLEGGAQTLLRDRPALIVELLTGAHADPIAVVEQICAQFNYSPWIVTRDGKKLAALPVIRALGTNTTWGSPIRNRNVLFLSKD